MVPDLANMARAVAAEAALRQTAKSARDRDPVFLRALWMSLFEFQGAEVIRQINARASVRTAEERETFDQFWAWMMES